MATSGYNTTGDYTYAQLTQNFEFFNASGTREEAKPGSIGEFTVYLKATGDTVRAHAGYSMGQGRLEDLHYTIYPAHQKHVTNTGTQFAATNYGGTNGSGYAYNEVASQGTMPQGGWGEPYVYLNQDWNNIQQNNDRYGGQYQR